MDHSVLGEGISAVALLLVFFAPLAIVNAREIRAWWRDMTKELP